MRRRLVLSGILGLLIAGCAGTDSGEEDGGGSGGTTATGGAASGGATGTGGVVGTGGLTGTGGATGTGGVVGSGGTPGTGGATSSGGTIGKGGSGGGGTSGAAGRGGNNGGAGTTGAAGHSGAGGGTAGTGSGGTSGTACGVTPVSPNASQQAKNLLCYLYSVYGNHVLSGQQETSWSNPAGDISWYASNGMKDPAILGGDFLYSDGGGATSETTTTSRAIAYWNAGGITMIRYHMGMPPNADSYENSMLTPSDSSFFTNVITSGTAENTSFVSKLDYMAYQINVMKTNNVPVLLALFHETQGNGWFWWSKGTGPQFVALWQYAFKYLNATKGLNNIVWLMPFSGSPSSPYFPGKAYVDISGGDTYGTNQPFTSLYTASRGVVGTTMPIPLHETGLIPTPSAMFPTAAPWVLFNIWAGYESDGTHNTVANIKSVYASSSLTTRDQIPNLK
jgi:Glycosyl hydrolase family 26